MEMPSHQANPTNNMKEANNRALRVKDNRVQSQGANHKDKGKLDRVVQHRVRMVLIQANREALQDQRASKQQQLAILTTVAKV